MASGQAPAPADLARLDRYDAATAALHCRAGCGACLPACPEAVPIDDVLARRDVRDALPRSRRRPPPLRRARRAGLALPRLRGAVHRRLSLRPRRLGPHPSEPRAARELRAPSLSSALLAARRARAPAAPAQPPRGQSPAACRPRSSQAAPSGGSTLRDALLVGRELVRGQHVAPAAVRALEEEALRAALEGDLERRRSRGRARASHSNVQRSTTAGHFAAGTSMPRNSAMRRISPARSAFRSL